MIADPLSTHDVENQPPPLADYDVYGCDVALVDAVERVAGASVHDDLHALGQRAGSSEAQRWGELANANPPVLHTHDRYGNRIDRVEYHPAYHELMRVAIANGLHAAPWGPDAGPGAHAARAAKMIVWSQVDAGHTCPISMTYSVLPALRHQPDLAEDWEPLLLSTTYDPSFAPRTDKAGVTCGMGMTEKQGGSDVRANSTRAEPVAGGDGGYLLTGHKWFCSAPMSDAFLMLAQADDGLTCFLVPRWLPDGTPNVFRIQRLKDKLGDRSNASSEIELAGTWAQVVGEPGRGVPTIIEMVNHTRLDCALGGDGHPPPRDRRGGPPCRAPAGLRRAARRQAAHAQRARRPGRRSGGSHGQLDVAGRSVRGRRRAGRRARDRAASCRHAGAEVLDLQAGTRPRQRGARVPRRRGVRRGIRAAPAVPAESSQRDLGGIRQRHLPRRAAGHGPEPGVGRGAGRRAGWGVGSRPPPGRRARRTSSRS